MASLAQQQTNRLNTSRATIQRKFYDFYYRVAVKYSQEDFIEVFASADDVDDLIDHFSNFIFVATRSTHHRGNNPLDDADALEALQQVIDTFMALTPGQVMPEVEPQPELELELTPPVPEQVVKVGDEQPQHDEKQDEDIEEQEGEEEPEQGKEPEQYQQPVYTPKSVKTSGEVF